jgi:hypothetical protein
MVLLSTVVVLFFLQIGYFYRNSITEKNPMAKFKLLKYQENDHKFIFLLIKVIHHLWDFSNGYQ